jgi:hypothetical protein
VGSRLAFSLGLDEVSPLPLQHPALEPGHGTWREFRNVRARVSLRGKLNGPLT